MSGSAQPESIDARIVSDEAEWDRLEADWSALFDASPRAASPLHLDWMRTWWRVYGPRYGRSGGLRLVTVRRGARLVGVLPLYAGVAGLGTRCLRFLSTGEDQNEETCPDYLDILCAPGEGAAVAAAALGVLAASPWDRLSLSDLPESSPLPGGLAGMGGRLLPGEECPFANLEGGFESYLKRLSSNGRQQARRLLRDAEKAGVVFELAGATQIEEFFADLVRLHQERWTGEG